MQALTPALDQWRQRISGLTARFDAVMGQPPPPELQAAALELDAAASQIQETSSQVEQQVRCKALPSPSNIP